MDNLEMIKNKILKDKLWLVIIVLIFIAPAYGFIVLVGKVLYTIAVSDMNKEDDSDVPSNSGYYRSTTFGEMEVDEVEAMAENKEEPTFDELMEVDIPVYNEPDDEMKLTTNHMDTDVHIEEGLTSRDMNSGHDHQRDKPIKTIACTMCGTLNDIYKIDIFETPSCQKCGMLLIDRT